MTRLPFYKNCLELQFPKISLEFLHFNEQGFDISLLIKEQLIRTLRCLLRVPERLTILGTIFALPYTVRLIRGPRGGQKMAKMVPNIVKRAGSLNRHLRVQGVLICNVIF